MKRALLFAAAVALSARAASAAVPTPSAAASAPLPRYPQASATDLGVTKLIGESDADAPVSGVQIFVAAGLDRESSSNNGASALVAECILRTPVATGKTGEMLPLRDAIESSGGSLSYTVDGRSVHYYLEGRSENLASLVGLFGKALAAPDFSGATLGAARANLLARVDEFEGNALSVGIQMFRRSYYTTGAGAPALGTAATLSSLSASDVAAFYRANYKRAAISASAVGRLVPQLGEALESLASALPDGPVSAVAETARPIPGQATRIIAHRDVSAPWVVVGFAAPAPNSRDFGAMLVLESLLSDAFERESATTLGFVERSVGAFYLYDSTPASLVVYVNGTQIDPTQALRELLLVSRTLSLKPLDATALHHFKTAAEGQFVTDSVNLSDRAYLLGTFASQGLGSDSINAALGALEATTSSDVQRVAKTYLQRYIVALVLPRQTEGS
jgi:predicted Zn-dependent peptidase